MACDYFSPILSLSICSGWRYLDWGIEFHNCDLFLLGLVKAKSVGLSVYEAMAPRGDGVGVRWSSTRSIRVSFVISNRGPP